MELQEQGRFSRTNFSSCRKVDGKVLQLLFYVLLVNECQSRAGSEVMDLGQKMAKGYFKHPGNRGFLSFPFGVIGAIHRLQVPRANQTSPWCFGHLTPAQTGLLGHSFAFRLSLMCCQLYLQRAVPFPGQD